MPPGAAVLRGYLVKMPVRRGYGSSHRRYVILAHDRIQWYESETSLKPKGELLLDASSEVFLLAGELMVQSGRTVLRLIESETGHDSSKIRQLSTWADAINGQVDQLRSGSGGSMPAVDYSQNYDEDDDVRATVDGLALTTSSDRLRYDNPPSGSSSSVSSTRLPRSQPGPASARAECCTSAANAANAASGRQGGALADRCEASTSCACRPAFAPASSGSALNLQRGQHDSANPPPPPAALVASRGADYQPPLQQPPPPPQQQQQQHLSLPQQPPPPLQFGMLKQEPQQQHRPNASSADPEGMTGAAAASKHRGVRGSLAVPNPLNLLSLGTLDWSSGRSALAAGQAGRGHSARDGAEPSGAGPSGGGGPVTPRLTIFKPFQGIVDAAKQRTDQLKTKYGRAAMKSKKLDARSSKLSREASKYSMRTSAVVNDDDAQPAFPFAYPEGDLDPAEEGSVRHGEVIESTIMGHPF